MHRFLLLAVVWMLCQCGAPSVPQCRTVPMTSRGDSKQWVREAEVQWRVLEDGSRRSEWPQAQMKYNLVLKKLVDHLRCGDSRWQENAMRMGTKMAAVGKDSVDPMGLEAVFPASDVRRGMRIQEWKQTDGLGIAMVGWQRTAAFGQKRPAYEPPTGKPYALTAVLTFPHGKVPEWKFLIRWSRESIQVGQQEHRLMADWSAPNVFYWQMCDLDDFSLKKVYLPERFSEETGLIFVTPYDPKKIPLVLVHGLVSSPGTYRNLINELAPQPWFRQNYQIWLYNYPTGNPWIYSAAKFRENLQQACVHARKLGGKGRLDQMVIVGHSMGGVIAHASVVDPGEKMYQANYRVGLAQLPAGDETKRLIEQMYLYRPLCEPKRVVYMAAPHQGSPAANFRTAHWVSKIIKLPKTLTVELLDKTVVTVDQWLDGKESPVPRITSINSLSPDYVNNRVLAQLPLPKGVAMHSIIGDRGRGDSPNSSDGVVPYWSSHLEPVESELVIPCNHGVPRHQAAAVEVGRILQKHLKQVSKNQQTYPSRS